MANQKELTATGTVHSDSGFVHSVALTGGSDAAEVILRDGGGSGIVRLTIDAAAGETTVWAAGSYEGVQYFTDIHATVSGTAPHVDVEYS